MRRLTLPVLLVCFALVGYRGVAFGEVPRGWFLAGSAPQDYEVAVDESEKHGGLRSAFPKCKVERSEGFATLMQLFRADAHRGKRLRLRAWVKAKDVSDWAGLWMRVDGATKGTLAFDNMMSRPMVGTSDWREFAVVLDVPAASGLIAFGIQLTGKGELWVDDFMFDVVGKDVASTNMNLEPEEGSTQIPDWTPKQPTNLGFEERRGAAE